MRWSTAGRGGRRAAVGAAVAALALLLVGCGGGGYTPAGPFRPLPQGAPPAIGPPTATVPAPEPGNPADPQAGRSAGDPNVVASGLAVPTGLIVLPDGSALVGERDTGRLLQVFPDRAPAKVLMTVPGVAPGGDGGLLGLALSPTFSEDGLVYAYLSTATDNRVVRFPIGGTPNPVLTGIPHGATHNGGGLLFAPDGTLYVGTGDAGNPAAAQDPSSLAGKVLHIDVFGHPADAGIVVASGFADVPALCEGGDHKTFAVDGSTGGADELDALQQGGDYGWPTVTASSVAPVVSFPAGQGGLAGCAVTGRTVFLGSLDGRKVDVVALDGSGGTRGAPTSVLEGRYGRLRTVVLDADGGLWVTTSNRDGHGTPAADDDKVLRIVPPTSSGDSPL